MAETQVYDPFGSRFADQKKKQAEETMRANNARIAEMEAQRSRPGISPQEWESISNQMHSIALHNVALDQQRQGINTDTGRSWGNEYANLVDPNTGKLRETYQLSQFDPAQFQGYNQFKQEALRAPGQQSAWAAIQGQKQAQEEAIAKDAAAKQAMAGNAQAQSQLAMRGGLGSGASTSLAKDMQRNLLMQRQGVARQGIGARLDIASKDEEARQRNLGQLVGFEKDIAQGQKNIEQRNLQNLMQEIENRRQFENDKYKGQMREWAAEREAGAAASGGGGK